MTRAVVAGPDADGLGGALERAGVAVTRVEGVLTADALAEAGINAADIFVLTDMEEATAIAVVKERNPDVRVVVYSHESLPAFASGQADIAMDPDLFDTEMVAEELA
ncbi:MAG: CTP synthetase [Haloplanus sp.]